MPISEIGLCHDGKMETAKEMIRISKECGADLVKGQAFIAGETKGSMPLGFYQERQLNQFQCIELILYARSIGIDMFYSIFSKEFDGIRGVQNYHKFSASQSKEQPRKVEQNDRFNVIVSVNPLTQLPNLKSAIVLYASPYLADNPNLEMITFLNMYYGRQVGYSDHTVGVEACISAVKDYGANVVEKHFTLTRDIYFDGVQFRDAKHSAMPDEMQRLACAMK